MYWEYTKFLKICTQKHVLSDLALDEVVHIACAAYNFVRNKHSEDSTFFLMFGRDAYAPLVQLLNTRLRYVLNGKNLIALDALQDVYALVIHNLKLSRERQADKFLTYPIPEFNVGNKVLIKNHTRDAKVHL